MKLAFARARPLSIVNAADAPEEGELEPGHWGATYKVLTPHNRDGPGGLGVALNRLPPGRVGCPFHFHLHEDEAFYIVRGRGLFRYGDADADDIYEVGPGDCIWCPANSGQAHQLANPFDEDLEYLAMGVHRPDEVCGYPDTGKVMVRALQTVGHLSKTPYMEGEEDKPRVLTRQAEAKSSSTIDAVGAEKQMD